jgi:hypothetical protein
VQRHPQVCKAQTTSAATTFCHAESPANATSVLRASERPCAEVPPILAEADPMARAVSIPDAVEFVTTGATPQVTDEGGQTFAEAEIALATVDSLKGTSQGDHQPAESEILAIMAHSPSGTSQGGILPARTEESLDTSELYVVNSTLDRLLSIGTETASEAAAAASPTDALLADPDLKQHDAEHHPASELEKRQSGKHHEWNCTINPGLHTCGWC